MKPSVLSGPSGDNACISGPSAPSEAQIRKIDFNDKRSVPFMGFTPTERKSLKSNGYLHSQREDYVHKLGGRNVLFSDLIELRRAAPFTFHAAE